MTLYIAKINEVQHAIVRAKSEERVKDLLKSKGFSIGIKDVQPLDRYNKVTEELVMIL